MDSTTLRRGWPHTWARSGTRGATSRRPMTSSAPRSPCTGFTQTITSSMRDYWDNRWYPVDHTYVGTPTAFGVFAHQTVPEGEPPRSYLERVYNIQRWTVFLRGGYFA